MTGIYVHIPFCARKCPYCDFYSIRFNKETVGKYVSALVRNIGAYADKGIAADTLYFGGGTPSLLTPQQIGEVTDAARRSFGLENAEITLEANPCTVDEQKLEGYRRFGVNRLSFGVQSANDEELRLLGRLHDHERAAKAVKQAQNAGFKNISCDIMLGTPGQTRQSLDNSVSALISLGIQHISAYMLKIEKGTAYDCDEIRNSIADDELMSELYLDTVKKLGDAGFAQYEISNFSKPGFESRHNLKYWTGESYLGFGASAHSFFAGRRFFCPDDVTSFIDSELQISIDEQSDPDPVEEFVMLGLRLTKGISLSRLRQLGGKDYKELVVKARLFAQHGLCCFDGENLSLTPDGFLVSNSIITEFIQSL